MKAHKDNKLGHPGVRIGFKGRYEVRISRNKVSKYLGAFDDLETAISAYNTAAAMMDPPAVGKTRKRKIPKEVKQAVDVKQEITNE
jgi:hypothetical protein